MLIINTFALKKKRHSRDEKENRFCWRKERKERLNYQRGEEKKFGSQEKIWRSFSTIQFANKSSLLCCRRRQMKGGKNEIATLINRLQSQPKQIHFVFYWQFSILSNLSFDSSHAHPINSINSFMRGGKKLLNRNRFSLYQFLFYFDWQ